MYSTGLNYGNSTPAISATKNFRSVRIHRTPTRDKKKNDNVINQPKNRPNNVSNLTKQRIKLTKHLFLKIIVLTMNAFFSEQWQVFSHFNCLLPFLFSDK